MLNNRYFVNNQPGYQDNSGGLYNKQDVAKAQSLLEGAGFTKGPDGIYQKGGKRLSFEMMTTQDNPLRSNTIDVITQQLKPVGIEIKKFLNPDIFAGKEKPRSLEGGQFQIALFAWVSAPYISGNQSIYQSPQGDNVGQNYTRGGDPRVDKLFPEINAATDDKTSQDLGNQVDKLLWDRPVHDPAVPEADLPGVQQQLHRLPGERQPGRSAVGLHEDRAEAVAHQPVPVTRKRQGVRRPPGTGIPYPGGRSRSSVLHRPSPGG